MASAWTALANTTLSATTATVTFSSISQAYRDLVLVIEGTQNLGANTVHIRFNSDSGSNYRWIYGTALRGGTKYSGSNFSSSAIFATGNAISWDSSVRSILTTNIFDYSTTDKTKMALCQNSTYNSGVNITHGRWNNTSAITSVAISLNANSFAAGTTFALYGVSA